MKTKKEQCAACELHFVGPSLHRERWRVGGATVVTIAVTYCAPCVEDGHADVHWAVLTNTDAGPIVESAYASAS